MAAKEKIDALIECRDALAGDEAYQHMVERIDDRIHEALLDAWFTGELDEEERGQYRWA